ncbi:ABC transporter ATP-binding protein [Metabacillus sp. 84]|uniref:ABC transporter ATP-binding protein n=1 Tax=unclassified Metabacillus TaxID=2675274 RepID=UPI003CE95EC4
MPYLTFDGTKQYKSQPVLERTQFTMEKGEILSLIGPSGTGKSTLLKCLAGLEHLDSGQIFLNGKNVTAVPARRREVVLVFQQALLFPHMTVFENAEYGLKLKKINKETRRKKVQAMLDKTEMLHAANRYPDQLSGGEQQRAALARALVMDPKLLLLDEPFASLDPLLRDKLRIWVKSLLKEQNITSIFVTHDMEEAAMIGDELAILHGGEILQKGKARDIYLNPANETAAAFYGDGLIINHEFIPSLKLDILKQPAVDGWKGTVLNEVYKYGRVFYRISVESQQITLYSAEPLTEGQTVYVSKTGEEHTRH